MESIKTGNPQRFPFSEKLNCSIVCLTTSQCCLLKLPSNNQVFSMERFIRSNSYVQLDKQKEEPEQQIWLLFLTELLRRQLFNLFSCRRSACQHGERRSQPRSEGRPRRHLRTPGDKQQSRESALCNTSTFASCYTPTTLNRSQPLVFIFLCRSSDATLHP